MYRGLITTQLVMLLLLFYSNRWSSRSSCSTSSECEQRTCSREQSRVVRSIFHQRIFPILDKYNVQMSIECPLHPEREQLWWPELDINIKTHNDISIQQYLRNYFSRLLELRRWTCPFCSLSFLSAERLIVHWDDFHASSMVKRDDSVCLADYCELFGCEPLDLEFQDEPDISNETTEEQCEQSQLSKLRIQCGLIVQQCSLPLHRLDTLDNLQNMQEELLNSLCGSYLTCDRYWQQQRLKQKIALKNNSLPMSLCLFITVVMIGGFTFCYFLVWMLFDTPINFANSLLLKSHFIRQNVEKVCSEKAQTKDSNSPLKLKRGMTGSQSEQTLSSMATPFSSRFSRTSRAPPNSSMSSCLNLRKSMFAHRSSSSDSIRLMQQQHLKNLLSNEMTSSQSSQPTYLEPSSMDVRNEFIQTMEPPLMPSRYSCERLNRSEIASVNRIPSLERNSSSEAPLTDSGRFRSRSSNSTQRVSPLETTREISRRGRDYQHHRAYEAILDEDLLVSEDTNTGEQKSNCDPRVQDYRTNRRLQGEEQRQARSHYHHTYSADLTGSRERDNGLSTFTPPAPMSGSGRRLAFARANSAENYSSTPPKTGAMGGGGQLSLEETVNSSSSNAFQRWAVAAAAVGMTSSSDGNNASSERNINRPRHWEITGDVTTNPNVLRRVSYANRATDCSSAAAGIGCSSTNAYTVQPSSTGRSRSTCTAMLDGMNTLNNASRLYEYPQSTSYSSESGITHRTRHRPLVTRPTASTSSDLNMAMTRAQLNGRRPLQSHELSTHLQRYGGNKVSQSQPPSLSQTPRPPSTNSTPYR